jgi:GTP-binding protein EngB required for normal cell division
MKNIDLDLLFSQLDEVGKFLRFRKKEIIKSIKSSLSIFSNNFNDLQTKYKAQNQETVKIKETLELTISKLDMIQNKYDLISKFLDAKPLQNDALHKFKSLIVNDFIDFANDESALAEEAKALLLLQDVEKRLEDIISFPSIYNKNIVAVGGGFSAGKSEFLNSFFIDKQIKLPVGINPVTAIPTYITVGENNSIKGYSYKGGVVELSSDTYKKLSHDFIKSLGFNLKDIAPIMAIETPMESYKNICFIDTPGYNPSNTGYTNNDGDTSKEYLNHANTLLWVVGIDTNGTIPKSDLDFLESIELEDKKIYIIANKADLRSRDDIEDILDDYDIEYEGISAFSSVHKREITYSKESLFYFLDRVNSPVEVQKSILSELDIVFDMYKDAINEQIKWTKDIQSNFKSLELDLLESGIDINNSDKVDERLEKMRNIFKTSHLQKQLKTLDDLRENIINVAKEIFISIK